MVINTSLDRLYPNQDVSLSLGLRHGFQDPFGGLVYPCLGEGWDRLYATVNIFKHTLTVANSILDYDSFFSPRTSYPQLVVWNESEVVQPIITKITIS